MHDRHRAVSQNHRPGFSRPTADRMALPTSLPHHRTGTRTPVSTVRQVVGWIMRDLENMTDNNYFVIGVRRDLDTDTVIAGLTLPRIFWLRQRPCQPHQNDQTTDVPTNQSRPARQTDPAHRLTNHRPSVSPRKTCQTPRLSSILTQPRHCGTINRQRHSEIFLSGIHKARIRVTRVRWPGCRRPPTTTETLT